MGWILILIIVLALVVLFVWRDYRDRVRRQSWEAKVTEACQLVRPIVEKGYNRLVDEIRNRWPLVLFHFPTVDDLMLATGSRLEFCIASRQDVETLARKLLEQVVTTAVEDFMNYKPDFLVREQIGGDKVTTKFSAHNDIFRTTKDWRNPPDWAKRRKIVYDRDGGRCRRCGVTISLDKCHIHHIVRRSQGGAHSLENLVTLCRDCHSLMPEHQKVNGGPFYTSYSGYTLHAEGCYHGTRRISGSLPSLLAKGYTPCMKCMPNVIMKRLWIERFARARLSAIVKSAVAECERELPSDSSES